MAQQELESAKPHGERLGMPLPEQSPFHCHWIEKKVPFRLESAMRWGFITFTTLHWNDPAPVPKGSVPRISVMPAV